MTMMTIKYLTHEREAILHTAALKHNHSVTSPLNLNTSILQHLPGCPISYLKETTSRVLHLSFSCRCVNMCYPVYVESWVRCWFHCLVISISQNWFQVIDRVSCAVVPEVFHEIIIHLWRHYCRSFISMATPYALLDTYPSLCIHSPIHKHLSCSVSGSWTILFQANLSVSPRTHV